MNVFGTTELAYVNGVTQMRISRSGSVARIQNYDGGSVANIALNWEGGNVGIGTTSPSQKLDVSGYARATSGFVGNGGLSLWGDNSSSSAGLFVTTGGNVGIGTTSPQSQLHIYNSGGTATLRLQGTRTSDGSVGVLNFSNITDITGGYIIGSIGVDRSGFDNGGAMIFSTATAASTPTERMRITSGGNLLVGTTTDVGYKLDVNGEGRFNNTLTLVSPTSSTALALLGRSTDNFSALRFLSNNAATVYATIYSNASDLIFENNGSERLKIASTGAATFSGLAGTGTRMVTANSSGQLEATQVVTWNSYTASVGDRINHTCGTTAVFPRYTVVGNIVTVQGTVSVGCITSADTYTEFSIPLPITGSATTGSAIMIGTGTLIDGNGKTANSANYRVVNVDLSAGKAYVNFYPRTNGNSSNVSFFFQYSIN
jgi:hypothetical protein